MEYSPITGIRVKNFRNIGDIQISFKESPIVTLMGENEAGKTSVVKAIAVAGANAYPARQARFVRTGTNGFGIQVDFADGSSLVRRKGGQGVGNTLQVLTPDGQLLRDDKIDRGEGIPVNMQKLMGFMVEPETGELLHVRTYEDALMFAVTPDSTNYKVMYNALKVGQITRAIKSGNQKANGLKSEVNNNSIKMDGIRETLKGIRLVDIEPAVNMKERLAQQLANLEVLEQAVKTLKSLQSAQEQLGALALIEQHQLGEVATRPVENLNRAIELARNLEQARKQTEYLTKLDNAVEIQTAAVDKLSTAIQTRHQLMDLTSNNLQYQEILSLSPIDTGALDRMNTAKGLASTLKAETSKLSEYVGLADLGTVDTNAMNLLINIINETRDNENRVLELAGIRASMTDCVGEIHKAGGNVGTCTNCGQLVVVVEGEEIGSCKHGNDA